MLIQHYVIITYYVIVTCEFLLYIMFIYLPYPDILIEHLCLCHRLHQPLQVMHPQSRPPKKKKKASDQVDELLVAELQKERDEAGTFGDHVAARLRRFSARQRAKACLEIDRILYDIEFPNEPVYPQPLSYPPQHLRTLLTIRVMITHYNLYHNIIGNNYKIINFD